VETEKIDFDKYANEYEKILDDDLEFFGKENGYFAEYKVKIVKDTISGEPQSILEYGCGIGLNLRYFKKYFPSSKISGCDISGKSIQLASKENSDVNFFIIDDESLNERNEEFDLIFVSCVFHHITPELRSDSITKIKNLLKRGGSLYIFEHNPLNPVTRKIVKDCPWDKDAVLLNTNETIELMNKAGFEISEKKFTLFFPAQLGFLRPLEKFLGYVPLGGQYFVKGIKK
jgi:SAM-dependent methyltransferase